MKAETIRAVRSRIRHIVCGSENFRMPVHPAASTRDDTTFYSSVTHPRLLPCQCSTESASIILPVTLLQVNFTHGSYQLALHFLIITNFISSEKGHLERNNIVVPFILLPDVIVKLIVSLVSPDWRSFGSYSISSSSLPPPATL